MHSPENTLGPLPSVQTGKVRASRHAPLVCQRLEVTGLRNTVWLFGRTPPTPGPRHIRGLDALTSLRMTAVALGLLGSSFAISEASAAMPVTGLTPAEKQISANVSRYAVGLRTLPLRMAARLGLARRLLGVRPWLARPRMAPVASLAIARSAR